MSESCVRLHYCPERNFGDALGKMLVESMSGKRIVYAKPYQAELLAVGSTLYFGYDLYCLKSDFFSATGLRQVIKRMLVAGRHPLTIWGAGFQFPRLGDVLFRIRDLDVRCVRGKLTLAALHALGFVADDQGISLGDPGLLFPCLLNGLVEKKYDIGIVPHYMDKDIGYRLSCALEKSGVRVCFVDVTSKDTLDVVRAIGSCEKILSSSLHGLVTADAFGIPNRHVCFSNLGLEGGGLASESALFKFRDYFSAARRPHEPIANAVNLISNPLRCLDLVRPTDVVSVDLLSELRTGLVQSFPGGTVTKWQEAGK